MLIDVRLERPLAARCDSSMADLCWTPGASRRIMARSSELLRLEVLIGGLMTGVLYSLVALGFVLIFKASGVFNFAQGAMVLFAALTLVRLMENGMPTGAGADRRRRR